MGLFPKLPKGITFKNPADFNQWNLSANVKGIKMLEDGEGNVFAVAAVIVDPTLSKVTAASSPSAGAPWVEHVDAPTGGGMIDLISRPGRACYLNGFVWCFGDATPVAAGITYLDIWSPVGTQAFRMTIWLPAAPQTIAPIVCSFSPQVLGGSSQIQISNLPPLSSGHTHVAAWGVTL